MLAQPVEKTPCFVVHLDAPLPPDDSLVRIPLAITGHWIRGSQPFSITLGDLEDIARNFQERVNGEINVDYDHASEMPEVAAGGPIPSAGRIVKLDPPEELRESGIGSRESRVGQIRFPTPYSRLPLYSVRLVRADGARAPAHSESGISLYLPRHRLDGSQQAHRQAARRHPHFGRSYEPSLPRRTAPNPPLRPRGS